TRATKELKSMTRADRMHSTPPTNSSLTRRNMIGAIAAARAKALTLAPARAAVPAADPIYAAIEKRKDLAKAFDAVWKLRACCTDFASAPPTPLHSARSTKSVWIGCFGATYRACAG